MSETVVLPLDDPRINLDQGVGDDPTSSASKAGVLPVRRSLNKNGGDTWTRTTTDLVMSKVHYPSAISPNLCWFYPPEVTVPTTLTDSRIGASALE